MTAGASLLGSAGSGTPTGAVSTTMGSSAAASAMPSTIPATRSRSTSGSPIANQTKAATASVSTGAAASNGIVLPGGLVGAVIGAFGARILLMMG